MAEVADRWNQLFWGAYQRDCAEILQRAQQLEGKPARDPAEQVELDLLRDSFSGGFCLGGYLMNDRTPAAFEILFNPALTAAGPIRPLRVGWPEFWGCPNLMERLLFGIEQSLFSAIRQSDKWTGSGLDLYELVQPFILGQPSDMAFPRADVD
jgi:hypothetical protein